MDEPILAEKDAKTEQKGESERDVLEGDAERPKKQAKLMESSSADSAIVHQLSEPNAEKDESNGNVETEKKDKNGKESFPRGRTVISFGYLGAGYQGLQLNEGAHTIEKVLFEAMRKSGGIYEDQTSLESVKWDRGARTDKGVSAGGNFISLNITRVPNLIEKINENLPDDIRCWHWQRTGKTFRAHIRADARRYTYIIPTFVFKPTRLGNDEPWKFNEETRQKIQLALDRFLGTHKYHHYTQSMDYAQGEAQRIVTSFQCSEPFESEGVEWVRLTVIGNSFVFNQIRKMVAFTVAVVQAEKDAIVIEWTFENIPNPSIQIAPGEGLFLEEILFHAHNRDLTPPNEPITLESVKETVQAFIDTKIVPSIINQEVENKVFSKWLETTNRYPVDWEKLTADAKEMKEKFFEEAKRNNYASARGLSTADENYDQILSYRLSKRTKQPQK